jgi:hypothetical protein
MRASIHLVDLSGSGHGVRTVRLGGSPEEEDDDVLVTSFRLIPEPGQNELALAASIRRLADRGPQQGSGLLLSENVVPGACYEVC